MSETVTQPNNAKIVFKGKLGKREAHKRGLVSDRQLAKLKQKERENAGR